MSVFIWVTIGVLIGSVMTNILYLVNRASGTLKIDQSNPEKDLYSLVIDDDLDKLPKKKRIVLKVTKCDDLSQK